MVDVAPPAQRLLDVVRDRAAPLRHGMVDEISDLPLRFQSHSPCRLDSAAVHVKQAERQNHHARRHPRRDSSRSRSVEDGQSSNQESQ